MKINDKETVLVLSGAGTLLAVANAVLSSSSRVLKAWTPERAIWLLRNLRVDTVVIHDEMINCVSLERECAMHGIEVRVMSGRVESGILRLALPELAGRRSAAVLS